MDHKDKIEFVNAIIDASNEFGTTYHEARKAVHLLPKEVKDLTEDKMKKVLKQMPIVDKSSKEGEIIEKWNEHFFS